MISEPNLTTLRCRMIVPVSTLILNRAKFQAVHNFITGTLINYFKISTAVLLIGYGMLIANLTFCTMLQWQSNMISNIC